MIKKNSFIKQFQLWGVIILIMLGGSFVIFDVTASYYDFNHRATQMRTHYLTQQKQTFKREVDSVVNMINFEKMKSEELTRDKIKMRLYEAYAIARNIYQQNKSSNDEAEILRLINDALRPIRFDNGCGYYFATTLDGVELLFADKPQMEGLNLLNVRDAHGRYVIKDMIAIVKQSGEGFYEYYWSKPNVEGLHYKKISYVKRFESCNWFIGTGLYVDDVEGQIKKELLDRIASIRFGLNADGYIFVVAYDGTTLMNDTQRQLIGKNIWELTDPNGVKVIQKEREAVENPEGGFISYVWNKPSQARPSPKISFLKGVKEWEWMVGAGIYLDDVENEIALQLTQLNHYTKLKILYFSLISVAIIAFFLFLFSRLRLKLINDFKLFISFFNNMSGSGTAINRDLIKYAELDQMAVKANRMLQDKLKVEQDLIDEKEKLSASENKFRSMMESMVDQVYIRSADYRIEYMNPAMIKRVGRDVTGEFCYRALHDFEKPCSWCSVMKVQQDEPFESDFVDQKDDRSYHISRSHVINEDGSVSTMTIFRDTTDLKKMEEQFYQSQKMEAIGTLAGGVAHDFNNILTVIRGHAQLGMMQTTEENPLWKDLVEIEAAGNRAHKLTRQLLAFSRKEVVQPEVVLVDALVTDLSKMLKRLIGEDITFEIKLEDDLSPILADPGQIEQIIINLVVNAADAIRNLPLLAGRNISIGVSEVLLDDDFVSAHVESRPGRHLLLEISDNGCGMSEEVMARIFEPFFTTKGEHRGTGLGLSTVFGIVRQNNANIYVASEIGQGTTFKIYWPILEERRPESLEVKDTETVSGGNEVILLVEDEEPARIMARNILRNAGYTVIEAENGLDALLQVEAFPDPVDLLFTDIVMPLMGGKELSEKLTATHPRIKFLFTSGYLSDRVDRDDKKFVEECFIEKPYDVSALLIKVRRILDS